MNLSKNFTLEEMVYSSKAKELEIDNTPNENELSRLQELCEKILQVIRDKFGKSIVVSSGFRCKKLNEAIKGSKTSQHCLGEAADIHTVEDTVEANKELYDLIVSMVQDGEIVCGQLINEYNYNWIHISLPNSKHINQIFSIK